MDQPEVIRLGPGPAQVLGLRVSLGILCVFSIVCLGLGAGFADLNRLAQGGFWSLLAWVNFIALLPDRIYLELSPDGFTERLVFFAVTRRWNNMDCFGTVKDDGEVLVVFRQTKGFNRSVMGRSKLWGNGWSGRLIDTYGMSPEKLAEMLIIWRSRYGQKPAGKSPFVDDLF